MGTKYNVDTSGNATIAGQLKVEGGSPSAGKVLTSDASGLASWGSLPSQVAGATTQVQFNNAGVFGADSNFVWDNTNKRLGVAVTPRAKAHVLGTTLFAGIDNTDVPLSLGADVLNVVSPTSANATAGSVETALRMYRVGAAGNKYNMSADLQIGSWATSGINAQSEVRLRLGNSGSHAPDTDVMSWRSNGNVQLYGQLGVGTASPTTAVGIVGNTIAKSTIASTMYSADNSIGQLVFVKSRGTEAAPTAILNNDFIADWRFGGQYSSTAGETGLGFQVFAQATENWTSSARGSAVHFASSKNGTVTTNTALTIESNNNIRVYERLGIGTSTMNGDLQFNNNLSNRKIIINELVSDNDHQFHGFGVASNGLRYQVGSTASGHRFYAGTSSTTSTELASITGSGSFRVNALTAGRVESSATGVFSSVVPQFQKAVQSVTSHAATTTWSDVPGCTVSITVGGTYRVAYSGRSQVDDKNKYTVYRLFQIGGSAVVNSESISATFSTSGTGGQGGAVNETFVSLSNTGDYKLQVLGSHATGCQSLSDSNGVTYITMHRL